MQYCYTKTAGMAGNLRFVSADYVAAVGEILARGDILPDIRTLHDPEVALSISKTSALLSIDQTAGVVRSGYITTTSGQEATYIEKARQSAAYQAAGYPEPADATLYSFVIAERTALGGTTTDRQACDAILAQYNQWLTVGASIEGARRSAKIAIAAAADDAAVAAALQAGLTALNGLANKQ